MKCELGLGAHAFSPCTQEAEAEAGVLNLSLA